MALYQVDSEKVLLGEYWTNRYIVQADSLAAATAIGADIVEIEQTIHQNIVTFTKFRTSDMIVGTDVYSITAVNQPGANAPGGDYLPLFNVCRCDFTTNGGGRPSRKYLRLPVAEGMQSNGVFTQAFVDFINTNYAELLQQLQGFVDVDGQAFSAGSCSPFVGMRQLRRGSKRRTLPILP